MVPAVVTPGSATTGNPAAGDFRLDDYPFFLIAQVDHGYSDQMAAALRSIRMNRPRWRVLMALRQQSPRSVSELARLATMKLSTISRVVDRLRGEGLISCAPRASDNRVTDVFLEPAGREALGKIISVAAREYQRAIAGLGDAEVEAFVATLRRIRANLQGTLLE
jgi:DNA-binding MarR family transcriptional regulator